MEENTDTKIFTFINYERLAAETAVYPLSSTGKLPAVDYTTFGLVGEAGEIANKLKKVHRDNDGIIDEEIRKDLLKEVGDTLWYLTRLATELNSDLSEIASINIQKLHARKNEGSLKGSGDNR